MAPVVSTAWRANGPVLAVRRCAADAGRSLAVSGSGLLPRRAPKALGLSRRPPWGLASWDVSTFGLSLAAIGATALLALLGDRFQARRAAVAEALVSALTEAQRPTFLLDLANPDHEVLVRGPVEQWLRLLRSLQPGVVVTDEQVRDKVDEILGWRMAERRERIRFAAVARARENPSPCLLLPDAQPGSGGPGREIPRPRQPGGGRHFRKPCPHRCGGACAECAPATARAHQAVAPRWRPACLRRRPADPGRGLLPHPEPPALAPVSPGREPHHYPDRHRPLQINLHIGRVRPPPHRSTARERRPNASLSAAIPVARGTYVGVFSAVNCLSRLFPRPSRVRYLRCMERERLSRRNRRAS